jgi:hypothetical protein
VNGEQLDNGEENSEKFENLENIAKRALQRDIINTINL